MAALAAKTSDAITQQLIKLGNSLGLAFQAKDDLADHESTEPGTYIKHRDACLQHLNDLGLQQSVLGDLLNHYFQG